MKKTDFNKNWKVRRTDISDRLSKNFVRKIRFPIPDENSSDERVDVGTSTIENGEFSAEVGIGDCVREVFGQSVEEWKTVNVPHDAMLGAPRTMASVGKDNIGWYEAYDYEYEKTFSLSDNDMKKKLTFEFEGVFKNTEVFINGQKACERPYGYTNFYIDANDYLSEGENTIRVIAHNSDQPNSRWYTGSGIYRPVWLWESDKENYIPINGVRVSTSDYRTGEIKVQVATRGEGEISVEILDGDSVVASDTRPAKGKSRSFRIKIDDAKLWSVDAPNMYLARVRYAEDEVTVPFGIRTLDWNTTQGLTINGKREILRGACIHHDNGILGACTYPEAELRRVRALKKAGYNAIRSAHNPCSKYLLDACDREGMLVMDEYIDHWYIHKTKYDYVDHMPKWWKRDLKDMVDKDFNHPSVIMYSTGNEVAETGEKRGIHWQDAMTKFLHEKDGTRPVTCGINIFFNFLYSIGMGQYTDDKADAEANKNTSTEEKKKPVGSEFYNKMAVKFGTGFMKLGASIPPSDWKTKDAYSVMDIAGYNYGIWRYRHDIKKYPDRLIVGSETFCSDAWLFWEIAKDNPPIVGDFVWSGMDYIGETGGGENGPAEYSRYNKSEDLSTCMTAGNGRVDLTGKLRCEAYYTLVVMEQEKGPFIGVQPVYEEKEPEITGWALTKAIDSWSFDGCEGKTAKVEVYARASEVELILNGVSHGRKKMPKKCRVRFEIPYQSGKLEAISYDENGMEIGRNSLISAGNETILYAEPECSKVSPEGLCFIRIRYADKDGITKVCEVHNVTVTVDGGELVGLGSGSPYVKGNYTDSTKETYYGELLAAVRAGRGKQITVKAVDESGNEAEATVEIDS